MQKRDPGSGSLFLLKKLLIREIQESLPIFVKD
ncbi:MAG: hypothetical protein RIT43_945 [Bacteroidota bacterium]|jgi:hypothetical protein